MERSESSNSCDNLQNYEVTEHAADMEFVRNLGKHSKKEIIRWCMKMNLISSEYVCPRCGRLMRLTERKDVTDGFEWKCRAMGDNGHSVIRSVRTGSLFNHSRLSLEGVLLITYMWARKTPREVIKKEMGVSERTLTEWKQMCREVCLRAVKKGPVKIGGPGMVVELREIKLARRCNYGKSLPGKHVLVGIECETKKCFITEIKFDSVESLWQIVQAHILPGTTVVSPCWGAYSRYEPQEFISMQRSCGLVMKFQSRRNLGHTEMWSSVREVLRGARQADECFDGYLAECSLRVQHYGDPDKLFLSFLQVVSQVQPPTSEDQEESEQEEVLGAADESCEQEVKHPLACRTYSRAVSTKVTSKSENEICYDPQHLEVVLITGDPD